MKKSLFRKNSILILSIILFLCTMFSVIFLNNKTEKANAAPVSSSFQMLPGLSVSLVSDNPKCAIAVSVTQDQYNKLTTPVKINSNGSYTPNPYYLAVVRVRTAEQYYSFANNTIFPTNLNVLSKLYSNTIFDMFLNYKDCAYVLYNIDPEHSRLSSDSFSTYAENGNELYRLAIDLPNDFGTEFYYFACFLEDKHEIEYVDDPMHKGAKLPTYRDNTYILNRSDYTLRSIQYVANRSLENMGDSLSEERLRLLQNYAGINVPTEKTTFYIQYEEWDRSGRAIQTSVESRKISSWKVGVNSLVISEMLDLLNKSNIADFDCVRVNGYSIDNIDYITDTKIIRQADDYVVNYNNDTQIGYITVQYRPFNMSDLSVRVTDNNLQDEINLTAYINFTDRKYNSATDKYTMRLPYQGETADHKVVGISNQLFNGLGWMATYDKNDFVVHNCPEQISVDVTDNEIVIEFDKDDEDLLKYVDIEGIAEIIPDFEVTVNINYSSVAFTNGILDVNNDVCDTVTVMYSEYLKRYNNIDAFKAMYLNKIEKAINPSSLNGVSFMEVAGITSSRTQQENVFEINVEYTYKPVFVVTLQKIGSTKSYKIVTANFQESMTYNGAYIVSAGDIPYGYRVQDIQVKQYLKDSVPNYDDYTKSTFTFDIDTTRNTFVKIPIEVALSDKVIVRFDYFERYYTQDNIETPFALKTPFETTLKYNDFKDYFTLGNESKANYFAELIIDKHPEKESIIEEKLAFMGLVRPDASLITYTTNNNGIYTFDIPYSYVSVKAQESDGIYYETVVPMTKYTDWTSAFGEDWGIMMLNHPNKIYFPTNDTDIKNRLYGLFGSVVFHEQVKNVNDWFNKTTNDACVVEYTKKEVVGSKFYKFIRENAILRNFTEELTGYRLPSILEIGAEIINDNNGVNYSHFFYLDGTSPLAYISNSGATDYDDNDSALKNQAQETTKKVLPYLYLIGGIVVGCILLYIGLKIAGLGTSLGGFLGKIFVILILIALCVGGFFYVNFVIDLIASAGGL